jgi:hypothetical protein
VVTPPPGAPSWWNQECQYYTYGWWETDIYPGSGLVSPPADTAHWASNFLYNTEFTAIIVDGTNISINLDNEYRPDLYKEIYIYITGTTTSTEDDIFSSLDTDGGVFEGFWGWQKIYEGGLWSYVVSGEIHPQPDYVYLMLTVPGLTNVTNIWAGENCIPEPATILLLTLGGLALRKKQ